LYFISPFLNKFSLKGNQKAGNRKWNLFDAQKVLNPPVLIIMLKLVKYVRQRRVAQKDRCPAGT